MTEIIAQGFGIIGLIIIVYSFQIKDNSKLLVLQGIGGFMFFLNFILINAVAGALYNLTMLVRGVLFSKFKGRAWTLVVIEAMYLACFAFSVFAAWGDAFAIFLSALPLVALLIMNVFMYKGNGMGLRYFQALGLSPAWIVHNIFNLSIGGLVCEVLNIISSIISIIRYRKEAL